MNARCEWLREVDGIVFLTAFVNNVPNQTLSRRCSWSGRDRLNEMEIYLMPSRHVTENAVVVLFGHVLIANSKKLLSAFILNR